MKAPVSLWRITLKREIIGESTKIYITGDWKDSEEVQRHIREGWEVHEIKHKGRVYVCPEESK